MSSRAVKCGYIGVVKSMPKPNHKTNFFRPGDRFRVGRMGDGFDLWEPRPKFTIDVFTIWSLKPFYKNRQALKLKINWEGGGGLLSERSQYKKLFSFKRMAVSNSVQNFLFTHTKRVGIARWLLSVKFYVYSFYVLPLFVGNASESVVHTLQSTVT